MIGQIATFIDTLHLSYKEVTEEIPFRVLQVMARDKVHVIYGKKVEHISGREMAAKRRK